MLTSEYLENLAKNGYQTIELIKKMVEELL